MWGISEFAGLFVSAGQRETSGRPAWVNLGTHHRTWVIDEVVGAFAGAEQMGGNTKQAVSLGAGSDSRFWRLRQRLAHRWTLRRWVETDFPLSVATKNRTIQAHSQLASLCGTPLSLSASSSSPEDDFYADRYCLLSADLRRPAELIEKLQTPTSQDQGGLLDRHAPTLILAELVFLYLSPDHTRHCLELLTSFFQGPLILVTYEALNLHDSFSSMMVQNLAARGLCLAGLESNGSVESQLVRMAEHGFRERVSTDMKSLRTNRVVSSKDGDGEEEEEWRRRWTAELARVRRLELVDEVEELELILAHYALSWARRDPLCPERSTVGFYLPSF